jgi:hypothetical protein
MDKSSPTLYRKSAKGGASSTITKTGERQSWHRAQSALPVTRVLPSDDCGRSGSWFNKLNEGEPPPAPSDYRNPKNASDHHNCWGSNSRNGVDSSTTRVRGVDAASLSKSGWLQKYQIKKCHQPNKGTEQRGHC